MCWDGWLLGREDAEEVCLRLLPRPDPGPPGRVGARPEV